MRINDPAASRPILTLLALIAAGCQLDARISAVETPVGTRLIVTYDGGKPACVQGLTVTALDGGRHNVWAIRRADPRDDRLCLDKFDLGATPLGYETVVTPRPLVPGARYEISATGSGWNATSPFSPSRARAAR